MLSRQRVTVTALVIIINASEFDGGNDAEGDESGNGTGADGDNDGMNAGNSETNNSGSANIGNGGTDTGNNSDGVSVGTIALIQTTEIRVRG